MKNYSGKLWLTAFSAFKLREEKAVIVASTAATISKGLSPTHDTQSLLLKQIWKQQQQQQQEDLRHSSSRWKLNKCHFCSYKCGWNNWKRTFLLLLKWPPCDKPSLPVLKLPKLYVLFLNLYRHRFIHLLRLNNVRSIKSLWHLFICMSSMNHFA